MYLIKYGGAHSACGLYPSYLNTLIEYVEFGKAISIREQKSFTLLGVAKHSYHCKFPGIVSLHFFASDVRLNSTEYTNKALRRYDQPWL